MGYSINYLRAHTKKYIKFSFVTKYSHKITAAFLLIKQTLKLISRRIKHFIMIMLSNYIDRLHIISSPAEPITVYFLSVLQPTHIGYSF